MRRTKVIADQAERLYAAENTVDLRGYDKEHGVVYAKLKELREFIVRTSVREEVVSRFGYHVINVGTIRESPNSPAGQSLGTTIKFQTDCRQQSRVLHEMAHQYDCRSFKNPPGHGPDMVGVLLYLLELYYPEELLLEFRQELDTNGVIYTDIK